MLHSPKNNRASHPKKCWFPSSEAPIFRCDSKGFREEPPTNPFPLQYHRNLRVPLPPCHPQHKERRPYEESTLQGPNISRFQGTFEDDFPFPQVGYVNSLEGINHHHPLIRQLGGISPEIPPQPLCRWASLASLWPMTGTVTVAVNGRVAPHRCHRRDRSPRRSGIMLSPRQHVDTGKHRM